MVVAAFPLPFGDRGTVPVRFGRLPKRSLLFRAAVPFPKMVASFEAPNGSLHKIEIWTGRHGVAIAEWPDRPFDPFFNVNTPEERARANEIARSLQPVRTA